MSGSILGLCVLLASVQSSGTPQQPANPPATSSTNAEQEVISLSKEKWRWMSERNVDSLAALFHEEAVFVHMGATMSRNQELDVIKSGKIQQDVDIGRVGAGDRHDCHLANRIRLGGRGRRRGHQSLPGYAGVGVHEVGCVIVRARCRSPGSLPEAKSVIDETYGQARHNHPRAIAHHRLRG